MKYLSSIKKITPLLLVTLLFLVLQEKILSIRELMEWLPRKVEFYEIKIQPDDLLMIIVSAEDPEIAML
jgi:polysaccharide export outer membrane protein